MIKAFFKNRALWLLVCCLLLALVGRYILNSGGILIRFAPTQAQVVLTAQSDFVRSFPLKKCGWSVDTHRAGADFPTIAQCSNNADKPVTALLIGDSHAEHYVWGLLNWAAINDISFASLTARGCPGLLNDYYRLLYRYDYDYCRSYTVNINKVLDENPSITHIFNANRWDLYIEPNLEKTPQSFLVDPNIGVTNDNKSIDNNRRVFINSMQLTLNLLEKKNIKTTFLGQVPMHTTHPLPCLTRSVVPMQKIIPLDYSQCINTPKTFTDKRIAFTNSVLKQHSADNPSIHFFDPAPYFCKDGICSAQSESINLYKDDDHLNYNGSIYISEYFDF